MFAGDGIIAERCETCGYVHGSMLLKIDALGLRAIAGRRGGLHSVSMPEPGTIFGFALVGALAAWFGRLYLRDARAYRAG